MYSVLVYFASVSIGFKFVFALLCFGLLLGGLIYGIPEYGKSPVKKKL